MRPQDTQTLSRRKSAVESRLRRKEWPTGPGPVMAGGNEHFEVSPRVRATNHGGIGLVHRLTRQIGLAKLIDDAVCVIKNHCPYHESDHVLALAYNAVCGGRTLDVGVLRARKKLRHRNPQPRQHPGYQHVPA